MRSPFAETALAPVAPERAAWREATMRSGWPAELALGFARRGARTVLATRHHRGPLTVQRPFHPEAHGACHVYLLHPPAGIVGGDELRTEVAAEADAHALVTTPAATRFYWSAGAEARLAQELRVAAGATLEWLPQETLLFAGAHARMATRVVLAPDARFCGWEILGLGRPACGEPFRDGRLDFRFELARAGRPLLRERLRGDATGVPGLRGHTAVATAFATPADGAALAAARAVLATAADGMLAGATLVGDVLVVRALAPRCEPVRDLFLRLWTALRPLVVGHVAVPPRIWHT